MGSEKKLIWECGEAHRWETAPGNIISGNWCPECAGTRKKSITEMHELAKKRNGKCLSKNYINCSTKIKWECAEGHKWEAIPSSINRGIWCPDCAGSRKKTIKEMHEIAKSRNGKWFI